MIRDCKECGQRFTCNSHSQFYCPECGAKRKGKIKSMLNIHGAMKSRCYNKDAKDYKFYGGKGVCISTEWLDYQNFKKWLLASGYERGLTVDRIDSMGDYCAENCHLLTIQDNLKRRSNRRTFHETGQARCKNCEEVKSFSDFHKNSSGVNTYCKLCRNAMRRKSSALYSSHK